MEGVELETRKAYLALQLAQVKAERGRTERARAANLGKQSDFFKCVPCKSCTGKGFEGPPLGPLGGGGGKLPFSLPPPPHSISRGAHWG